MKIRIEAFAATQENFPDMLRRARQYLVARGKLDWTDPVGLSVPNLRRTDSLGESVGVEPPEQATELSVTSEACCWAVLISSACICLLDWYKHI